MNPQDQSNPYPQTPIAPPTPTQPPVQTDQPAPIPAAASPAVNTQPVQYDCWYTNPASAANSFSAGIVSLTPNLLTVTDKKTGATAYQYTLTPDIKLKRVSFSVRISFLNGKQIKQFSGDPSSKQYSFIFTAKIKPLTLKIVIIGFVIGFLAPVVNLFPQNTTNNFLIYGLLLAFFMIVLALVLGIRSWLRSASVAKKFVKSCKQAAGR